MNLKTLFHTAVQSGSDDEVEKLVAEEPRAIRFALGLTYSDEPGIRRRAAKAVAFGSKHHQSLVENIIRRLVWAMNDESGTNAVTAPEVLQAIADERPELLLPVLPDLVRLSKDPGLNEGLAAVLRAVSSGCPGEVGSHMVRSIDGSCCGDNSARSESARRRFPRARR